MYLSLKNINLKDNRGQYFSKILIFESRRGQRRVLFEQSEKCAYHQLISAVVYSCGWCCRVVAWLEKGEKLSDVRII